mgnify:CR=1 FL=1
MKQVDPYEDLDINAYGVLKPPLLLLIILLIETWQFWSLIVSVFSGQSWVNSENSGWMGVAVAVPALTVLYALWARVPKAGGTIRQIWSRGREMLSMSAAGNLAITIFAVIQDGNWRLDSDWTTILVAILHIWVAIRLWVSPIIQKVFSEFPS